MAITVEIHHGGKWHQAAKVHFKEDELGFQGPSKVEYCMDYWMDNAAVDMAADRSVFDHRALSIEDPVDLDDHHRKTWPPFLLDLMPQGHARRQISSLLGINENSRSSDLPLLLRAGGNPIGNLRIKEAAAAEAERIKNIVRKGVSEDELFGRSDRFIEIVDYFALLASGSSGLQGEWPKVAMTQASDGLYYPDVLVADEEAVRHVIIKLLRSKDARDEMILEGEAIYAKIARRVGLDMREPSSYAAGVLIIPRFDRRIRGDGTVERIGQESLVSASGIAEFGHVTNHERYIDVIRRVSDEPFQDIVEYVKRDIANQALGNPDNHGRNSALSKSAETGIRLSPLYDFAPMRLAQEGVARSTRWATMRDRHLDHLPDWPEVAAAIFPDDGDRERLFEEIIGFAEALAQAPEIARELGAKPELVERAMRRCEEFTKPIISRPTLGAK